jgi:hypothetical protein
MASCVKARHYIDTAILRTSSQLYREAYNVMVKSNRFVLVESTSDLPFFAILRTAFVPLVTMNQSCAFQFEGYTMKVTLSSKCVSKNKWNLGFLTVGPSTAMMLARDLDLVCKGIMQADSERPADNNGNAICTL